MPSALSCSKPAAPDEGILQSALGGLKAVSGQARWIGVVILQGALQMAFVIGPEVILLPLVLHRRGHLAGYGWILAIQGLGTVAGAAFASRWKPQRPGLAAVLAILGVAPELILLASDLPFFLLAASVAATGWGYATFAVLWGTSLQQEVPEHLLSLVASLDAAGGFILLPISTALTGMAVASTGLGPVIAVSGTVLLITTVLPLTCFGLPAQLGGFGLFLMVP